MQRAYLLRPPWVGFVGEVDQVPRLGRQEKGPSSVECGRENLQFRQIFVWARNRRDKMRDKIRGLNAEEPCRLLQGTQRIVLLC